MLQGREWIVVDPHTGGLVVEVQALGLTRRWVDEAWTWDIASPLVFTDGAPAALEGLSPLEEGGWIYEGPEGTVTYDAGGLPVRTEGAGLGVDYTWDELGLSRLDADWGTVWHLRYDAFGNRALIESEGVHSSMEYREGLLLAHSTDEDPRTRYSYDGEGRLQAVMWVDGSVVRIRRDDEGRVSSITGPGSWRQSYSWSDSGVIVHDALGIDWSWQRDETGSGVRDPSGRQAWLLTDEEGQVSGWRDPRGLTTNLERTDSGHIATVATPAGTWRLGWNTEGGLVSLTDPAGARWRIDRDLAGRVVAMGLPDGRTLRWARDGLGRIKSVDRGGTVPVVLSRDGAGRVKTITTPRGARTNLRRDGRGRVTSIQDAAGNEIFLARWDKGGPAQILDRRGSLWEVDYDILGRVRRITGPRGLDLELSRDPSGNAVAIGANELLRRTDGALTRLVDAAGGTWGLLYDLSRRPRALLHPDGGRTVVRWNSLGEKLAVGEREVTRDLNQRPVSEGPVAWDWDLAGRFVGVTLPSGELRFPRDGAGKVREVQLGEQEPWKVTWDGSGRTSAFVRGGARVQLRRDPDGLIVGMGDLSLDRDERGVVFRMSYDGRVWRGLVDSEGLMSRWTGPDGQSISVDRDQSGALSLVRYPDGTLVRRDWSPGWDGLTVEDPSGDLLLDRRIQLDAKGRPQVLEERTNTGDLDRTVHRDPAGNIVALEQTLGAWTWTPGQFESPDGALVLFDEEGLPSEATPPLGPAAWGVGAEVLTYIPNREGCIDTIAGELGSWRLEHDALGRLVRLSSADATIRVEWDLFGRPLKLTGPEGSMHLIWSQDQLLGWTTSDEEVVELVGSPDWGWFIQGEEPRIVVVDDEGSPRLELLDGEVVSFQTWTPTAFPGEEVEGPSSVLGPGGSWLLMAGGPLLDSQGAWDPVSGTRTCGEGPLGGFPALDGTGEPWWDPEPWLPESVWTNPLELLVALGELDPLFEEDFVLMWEEAPALPWLPQATATPSPPLAHGPGWLPMDLDPVTALLVRLAVAPVAPPTRNELLEALLAPELEGQPRWLLPPLWETPEQDTLPGGRVLEGWE